MVNEAIDRQVDTTGHYDEKHVTTGHAYPERTGSDEFDDKTPGVAYGELKNEHDGLDEAPEFDPYKPFDDLPDEAHRILTVRAVIVGVICGALVNASNVYLGLKTGFTFSANLFGAIIGFGVLKGLAKSLPENFPIFGGNFGPRENNIVQTVATAAGGLGGIFISGVPAMYRLELLSGYYTGTGDSQIFHPTPTDDLWRIISLTAVGGYFGFTFSTPMRKLFIIHLARELKLVFPTPTATSLTIRSMHAAATGEGAAKLKLRALSLAFSWAIILRVISQYCLAILWDWRFFNWVYIWSGYKNKTALRIDNWGFYIQWTYAFIGSGMLVGLNTAISFYVGGVLSWGIIGPSIVSKGWAHLKPYEAATNDTRWQPTMNPYALGTYASKDHPSPRFWMLWPGVMLMIVVSFTELFLQYKIFWAMFKAIGRGVGNYAATLRKKEVKQYQEDPNAVQDPALPEEMVKWWYWLPLMIVSIVAICVVMGVQYGMPVGMSILSIVLAYVFAIVAVQCGGVTDITPLTAASKASQLILGGATKGEHWEIKHAQKLNLIGGVLASMSAGQAADLTSDFRVGFLLRTPPNQQWLAQGLGTIVAVFIAPALFVVFTKAYPCVLTGADVCPFSGPSIAAWVAVAQAVTLPELPVPKTSGIFAIAFSAFAFAMTIFKHFFLVGKWEKYRLYYPNFMTFGLAWVLPGMGYSTAMLIGAIGMHFWNKYKPVQCETYAFPIAAGFIAGEGIGGLINAILAIGGVDGNTYGALNWGCNEIFGCDL